MDTTGFTLVQETALDTGDTDLIMTKEQWDKIKESDQHFCRRLAGAASTDEVTGKSTLLEIQQFVVCQRSLSEYAED